MAPDVNRATAPGSGIQLSPNTLRVLGGRGSMHTAAEPQALVAALPGSPGLVPGCPPPVTPWKAAQASSVESSLWLLFPQEEHHNKTFI